MKWYNNKHCSSSILVHPRTTTEAESVCEHKERVRGEGHFAGQPSWVSSRSSHDETGDKEVLEMASGARDKAAGALSSCSPIILLLCAQVEVMTWGVHSRFNGWEVEARGAAMSVVSESWWTRNGGGGEDGATGGKDIALHFGNRLETPGADSRPVIGGGKRAAKARARRCRLAVASKRWEEKASREEIVVQGKDFEVFMFSFITHLLGKKCSCVG